MRLHAIGSHAIVFYAIVIYAIALGGCVESEPDGSEAPGDCDACLDAATDGAADGGEMPACLDDAPPVDIVLVIDDSGSMCEEQSALVDALIDLDGRLDALGWDWQIARVTTDMNPVNRVRGRFGDFAALPVPTLNCIDETGAPAVPDTDDCRAFDPVMRAADHDAAERHRLLRCQAQPGTQGDGFEQGLAAVELALSCAGPNAAQLAPCGDEMDAAPRPFLRPGATLAVVFVADEDDCSDGGAPGEPIPAECGAVEAGEPCVVPRVEGNACVWMADRLRPVDEIVAALRQANPEAAGVTATAVVGPRFPTIDGQPVRFTPGEPDAECVEGDDRHGRVDAMCCPDGVCVGGPAVVCEGPRGSAFAGDRYRAAVEALGGCVDDCPGVCDGDAFDGLAGRIIEDIRRATPPVCPDL